MRLSPAAKQMIRAAAQAPGKAVSEFLLDSALAAAKSSGIVEKLDRFHRVEPFDCGEPGHPFFLIRSKRSSEAACV